MRCVELQLTQRRADPANLAGDTPAQARIDDITPQALDIMTFAAGSMGPKVAAASQFVRAGGRMAGIGRLQDARAILEGHQGTRILAEGAS